MSRINTIYNLVVLENADDILKGKLDEVENERDLITAGKIMKVMNYLSDSEGQCELIEQMENHLDSELNILIEAQS